jgi:hypothetical protein
MDTRVLVAVIVAVVLVAGAITFWTYLRNRSRKLHERFGPEYERAIREMGGRRHAEEVLEKREKRVDRLHIRPLRPADQTRFKEEWRQVQARFVDDPNRALNEADELVGELMNVRGYPVVDFEQRAADISVDHPFVVENYRAAHTITLRHRRGEASTEDLRQAMVQYRTLFDELLGARELVTTEVRK